MKTKTSARIAAKLMLLAVVVLSACGPASPTATSTTQPTGASPEFVDESVPPIEDSADSAASADSAEGDGSAVDNAESSLSAEPASVGFSLDAAQLTTPDDVLAEVMTTVGGGGGGCGAVTDPSIFAEAPNEPVVELMAVLDLLGCNWKPGDAVIVTATLPDGQTLDFQADVEPDGTFNLPFQTALQDAPGEYAFAAKSSDGVTANATIEVSAPDGPRMRSYGDRLFLYNFVPNERVRLIAYRFDEAKNAYEFAGWQSFNVDANGRLFIDLDDSAQGPLFAFGVVGDVAGPVSEFAIIGAIETLVP
jgi:hypothetical protein